MRRSMILLAALLVAGCGDEEGNTSYLRVVVDGEAWSGEATEGQVAYYVEGGSGIWTIASQPSTGGTRMLTLVVPVDPAVGSYPLDQFISRTAFSICPDLDGIAISKTDSAGMLRPNTRRAPGMQAAQGACGRSTRAA